MKGKFFLILFTCFSIFVISCVKEPRKGEYKGVFTGKYTTDTMSIIYTTEYYFDVTRSTNKKLYLQEKQSQITSILIKQEPDSISGMIGFGDIFNLTENAGVAFNTIKINGKCDRESIIGQFSTTITDGNKEYFSQGDFKLTYY
jgi:hypothetical protein